VINSSRSRSYQNSRSGVSDGVIAIVLLLLAFAAFGYFLNQALNAPKANITVSLGARCGTVNFQVTNTDSRILHGWSVKIEANPSGSGIVSSPVSAAVIALAPQGNYSGSFTVSYSGAPPGDYSLKATLVNGTQTIASSNTLTCKVG
jgi:hypothetical protein